MKNIIVLFLFPFCVFSQVNSGTISYKISFAEDTELSISGIGDLYQQAKDKEGYVAFELNFNNEAMDFRLKEMIVDDSVNYAVLFSETEGVYYRKKNDSIVYQAVKDENFGNLIIVSANKLKWDLVDEIKVIDQYTCYKATSSYIMDNGIGKFSKSVVAWYCPALSFPYGPKGYGGLPGLILELQDDRVNFEVKKINYYENLKIEKPVKGKEVSASQYQKMYKDLD